jgi:hypothetical protein
LNGHLFELLGAPLGMSRFASFFQIAPMSAEHVPNSEPDILQNLEVVVLGVGLGEHGPDGVGIRFPMIDVKSVHGQSELFEPLQKGVDVFFVALFNSLPGRIIGLSE